jgi:hypothetical protein
MTTVSSTVATNVQRRDLSDDELDLLIQFKLEGTSGKSFMPLNGNSWNAVRQRMKRVHSRLCPV